MYIIERVKESRSGWKCKLSLFSSYGEKLRTVWNSNYFRRNFILILLITAIPGIISGLVIYWFSVSKVEDELMQIHENQVEERVKNIDDQFKYLEESVSNRAYDPRFDSSLLDLDFAYQFQETRDIMKSLRILQRSHPLIENVELFIDANKPILFNPIYNIVNNEEEVDFLKTIISEERKVISWHYFTDSIVTTWNNKKLALIHKIPGVSEDPFGMIIITVNKIKLSQLLETLTPYDKGATILLKNTDETLAFTNSTLHSSFEHALKQTAKDRPKENDSFQFEWEGDHYSVSYGVMNRMGEEWTYISAAPISGITEPVVNISRVILIISFSVLLLAILMTWFATNKIYRPLNKLLQTFIGAEEDAPQRRNEFELIEEKWSYLTGKSEELQKEITKQIPQLKNNFLNQLRNGYLYNYTEVDLQRRMESYGWETNNKDFMFLDVQLTIVYEAEITTEKDESLFTFAVANIIDESAKTYFDQYTTINDYDLSVGLFLVLEKDEDIKEKIITFVDEITKAINKILNLKVTITLSEKTDQVKQIPFLFNMVGQGKRQRDFENENQIIDLSQAETELKQQKLMYPFETEKKVIQSIRRGHIEETEQLVRVFIKELTEIENKEISIQMGMQQLFSTVQHEILRSGIQPKELYSSNQMMERLSQIRESEWMVRWLIDEIIDPYIQMLEGRLDIEMKQLVETVKEYINKHYMDDISLDSCADLSGTSSYTLSKSFNKILGVNFIDYLTDLRINKAKELLESTDMKIGDIAESVGYRHSYFNRVFRRQAGVPPSQYRKTRSN